MNVDGAVVDILQTSLLQVKCHSITQQFAIVKMSSLCLVRYDDCWLLWFVLDSISCLRTSSFHPTRCSSFHDITRKSSWHPSRNSRCGSWPRMKWNWRTIYSSCIALTASCRNIRSMLPAFRRIRCILCALVVVYVAVVNFCFGCVHQTTLHFLAYVVHYHIVSSLNRYIHLCNHQFSICFCCIKLIISLISILLYYYCTKLSTQLKFIEKGSQMAKTIQYIKTNQMIEVNEI